MKNKLLSLLLILSLLFIAQTQVVASDIISGEYTLTSSYNESDQSLETLTKINLNFDQGNLTNAYHFDFDYEYNISSQEGNLTLNEAYFDYYGSDFDLRVGQQIVNWGSALEYNPTDNLNPIDSMSFMSDKKPIFMLNGKYYFDYSYSIEGAIIPYHVPSVNQIMLNNMNFTADPVEDSLSNMEYALKWSGRGINGFDFSISYFNGFEDLPTIGFMQTQMGPMPDPNNVYFRRVSIYGTDIATSYKGVGLWGEAAFNSPEEGEDYYSVVAGSDYNFSNGIYLAGQVIYMEDKLENKNVILQTAVENTFNKIHKFRIGSVYNFETEGYLIRPEVEFSLADATLLTISYQYNEGQLINNDMLSGTTNENSLNIELSYSF